MIIFWAKSQNNMMFQKSKWKNGKFIRRNDDKHKKSYLWRRRVYKEQTIVGIVWREYPFYQVILFIWNGHSFHTDKTNFKMNLWSTINVPYGTICWPTSGYNFQLLISISFSNIPDGTCSFSSQWSNWFDTSKHMNC